MNARDEIGVLASAIYKGGSQSGVLCPFCRGGRSGERSMSITHREDGTKLYICHRVSCLAAGRIGISGDISWQEPRPSNFTPRVLDVPTRRISDEEVGTYLGKWNLSISQVRRFRLSFTDISERSTFRLVTPIYSREGVCIGNETRRLFDEDGSAKTIHLRETDRYPWLGYFYSTAVKVDRLILVEDAISAIRCSEFIPAVALMGSHFTLEEMMSIVEVTDNIILALDKDATNKAYDLAKKYSFVAPKLRVIPLERDLKMEQDDTLRKVLS